jgi:hypothetical protein
MATYRVTAPNGQRYRINGPDDATPDQIEAAVREAYPEAAKSMPAVSDTDREFRGMTRGGLASPASRPAGAAPPPETPEQRIARLAADDSTFAQLPETRDSAADMVTAAPAPRIAKLPRGEYDPTLGMSFPAQVGAGAVGRAKELGLGVAQTLLPKSVEKARIPEWAPLVGGESIQGMVDEQKRLDAPLKSTAGGFIGGLLPDLTTFAIPIPVAPVARVAGGALAHPTAAGVVSRGVRDAVGRAAPDLAHDVVRVRNFMRNPWAAAPTYGAGQATLLDPLASDESLVEKGLWGAGGAVAGNVLGAGIKRLVSPNVNVNKQHALAAKLLEDSGVDLSSGQATGSKGLQAFETGMGSVPFLRDFTKAGSQQQREQFTTAIAQKLGGADADRVTPELIEILKARKAAAYDKIRSLDGLTYPPQYMDQLNYLAKELAATAKNTGSPPSQNALTAIAAAKRRYDAHRGGDTFFDGETWLKIHNDLSALRAQAIRSGDYEGAKTVRDIIALERMAAGSRNPVLVRRMFTEASQLHGTIEDLQKSGVVNAEGYVNPGRLARVLKQSENKNMPVLPDLRELAYAGGRVLPAKFPDTGTARNLMIANLLLHPVNTLGVAAGAVGGLPLAALASSTALGLTQTKWGKTYLTNKLLDESPSFAQALTDTGRVGGARLADYLME